MLFVWKRNPPEIPPFYCPSLPRYWMTNALYGVIAYFIGWLFFEAIPIAIICAAVGCCVGMNQRESYTRRMKQLVSSQFEQVLFSLASSLQAGRSVENAFQAAAIDLSQMYGDSKLILVEQLNVVVRKVETGMAIEKAVDELQRILAIPEITGWSDMLLTCKRTGGNLVHVMRHTSRLIAEKMNMERELFVMIAGKRFEAKVLSIVPFGIIGGFRYGSPDYLEPLYSGSGRIIMTVSLFMLLLGIGLTRKLMRIEV